MHNKFLNSYIVIIYFIGNLNGKKNCKIFFKIFSFISIFEEFETHKMFIIPYRTQLRLLMIQVLILRLKFETRNY